MNDLVFLPSTTCDFGAVRAFRKKYFRLRIGAKGFGNATLRAEYDGLGSLRAFVLESSQWTRDLTTSNSAAFTGVISLTNSFTFRNLYLMFNPIDALGPVSGKLTVTLRPPSGSGVVTRTVQLTGSSILDVARKLIVVIDRSASMSQLVGTRARLDVARDATNACLSMMGSPDFFGLVSFAQDATSNVPIDVAGTVTGATVTALAGLSPAGPTSMGVGVQQATSDLASSGSLLVLTDGLHDVDPAVPPGIGTVNRYAVVLNATTTPAVEALIGAGGKALVLDANTLPDVQLNVNKYVAQILLDVQNTAMVLDPDGVLGSDGASASFEFPVTELDQDCQCVLLSNAAERMKMRLFWDEGVRKEADDSDQKAEQAAHCEPAHPPQSAGPRQLSWLAPEGEKPEDNLRRAKGIAVGRFAYEPRLLPQEAHKLRVQVEWAKDGMAEKGAAARFSLFVTSKSDLLLDAQLYSSSPYVGGELLLSAVVSEAGLVEAGRGQVAVEFQQPDGSSFEVMLKQDEHGRFSARIPALRPGVYRAHFIATGQTLSGHAFRREALRTQEIFVASRSCCCGGEAVAMSDQPRTARQK